MTILRNLVANAIRYTEQGKVLIGVRRHHTEYVVGVLDTGVGIDEDKLQLVFEEFYQVGNQSRDSKAGLGLGLSIVDRMSRILGHRIVVRSNKGVGSAFCVVVPKSPEHQSR
jgi:two-component system CheB/CheR fusion protein